MLKKKITEVVISRDEKHKVIVDSLCERIKTLEKENADLKNKMSYMTNPLTVGDRHEMGG